MGLSMAGRDLARCGEVGSGRMRRGKARSGMAGDRTYCKAWSGTVGPDQVWQDGARWGGAMRGRMWYGPARWGRV